MNAMYIMSVMCVYVCIFYVFFKANIYEITCYTLNDLNHRLFLLWLILVKQHKYIFFGDCLIFFRNYTICGHDR